MSTLENESLAQLVCRLWSPARAGLTRGRPAVYGAGVPALSRRSGISVRTLQRLLAGRARSAAYETMAGIAQALGCAVDDVARALVESARRRAVLEAANAL